MSKAGKGLTNLSLTEIVGLLSCAGYFVGNDSGITHLAAGLGTKTIAIFGPTNPNMCGPVGPKVTLLKGAPAAFATGPSEKLQQVLIKILETA